MKRIGYLYEKVISIDNIELAIIKASKGKNKRKAVNKILDNIDYYVKKINNMLKNKTYIPSPYIEKTIKERLKERIIYKPRFYPDQCIHWALMLQLEKILMNKMYYWNCASIKGRGLNHAFKYIKRILKVDNKNTKYCLKLDVKKFYPSIDKNILKNKFRKIIKDKDLLWLIDKIIDSNEKGLPIGNYTSQWFANFYLTDLDNYIKQESKVKYYTRYMDDMILFSSNKKELHKIKLKIENYLNKNLNLKLKENWQLFKTDSRPLDFLGYRFNRKNKQVYITLRKNNFLRFKRRINKISKKTELTFHDSCAIISIWGWVSKSNGYNYMKKYIIVPISKCKEVIRNETRKQFKT